MRKKLLLALCAGLLAVAILAYLFVLRPGARPALPQRSSESAGVAAQADQIVRNFRRIIVLTEGEAALDPAVREQVSVIAQILFEENVEKLAALSQTILQEQAAGRPQALDDFLSRLETNPAYHDADKLAFRDALDDLAAQPALAADASRARRVAEDAEALNRIHSLYETEMKRVAASLGTRAMAVRREAWDQYLAALRKEESREKILQEMAPAVPASGTRGARRQKNPIEIFGNELPEKTLLLTFDDGPHPRYTDAILAILKKFEMQAVFFQVGRNLGKIAPGGEVTLTPAAAASFRILESGSSLANHSYTHAALPKLDPAGYANEIESTDKILKVILKSDPVLFRPPYGARTDEILSVVEGNRLKSMMWNVDSLDWADPVPSSIVQRVLDEVEKQGRGILLFHDIQKRTLEVLPTLLETLQARGYHFASWNGSGFSVGGLRGQAVAQAPPAPENPYRESFAVVVGIDDYQNWPKLRYAANDARAVREVLIAKHQFKAENVFLLLNQEATRESILSLLGDRLANPEMVHKDDRVLVFFAGHGATRQLPSGRDLGYIIPVDADLNNYQGRAISMTNFQDIAEAIPAKHLLFIMDSCYSGLALTRGGPPGPANYLREISRRGARQMLTAGGADQQVADNGPNGHSVFTWTLLQALQGRGDLNGDGVVTASEVAAYVAPAVSALSRQTPAFGNLAGSEGGDFIFTRGHESDFLEASSPQLPDDAIRLNAEVEQLRVQNQQLQKELAAARSALQPAKTTGRGAATASAPALNDEGMRLYSEKKYADAAARFAEAASLDSSSALFANNAGFAQYKLGQNEEAVRWFEQAIARDPSRAVAYVNLGDACLKLGRKAQARQAFEKYLQMAPASKSSAYVKEKLQALNE